MLVQGLFLHSVSIRAAAALSLPHFPCPPHQLLAISDSLSSLRGHSVGEGAAEYTAQEATCHSGNPTPDRTRRPRLWPWMRQVLFPALVSLCKIKKQILTVPSQLKHFHVTQVLD